MVAEAQTSNIDSVPSPEPKSDAGKISKWKRVLGHSRLAQESISSEKSTDEYAEMKAKPEKWSMGVLNDRETEEVPGQ